MLWMTAARNPIAVGWSWQAGCLRRIPELPGEFLFENTQSYRPRRSSTILKKKKVPIPFQKVRKIAAGDSQKNLWRPVKTMIKKKIHKKPKNDGNVDHRPFRNARFGEHGVNSRFQFAIRKCIEKHLVERKTHK